MNNMAKNLLLWLLIAAVLLSVFNNFNLRSATEQVGYSEFIREVQTDRLSKVLVDGLTITAQRKDGSSFETIRPMVEDPKLMDDLLAHNVTVEGKQPERQSVWTQLLIASFPILLIIAVFMFFMRQMQGGGGGRGGPMSFGKSKAKLLGEDQITTTFADVAGVEEAKEDVQELVEFLRSRSVSEVGRSHSPRRLDGRAARYGQDLDSEGHRRRGEGAFFLDLRLGLCGNVRRSGRVPCPRHVRASQETITLHHLHRRDRRRGPAPRCRTGRWP